MKKRTFRRLSTLTAILTVCGTAAAAFAQTTVELNGQLLNTTVPPIRVNGSTLVPMRDIFEALGAHVRYDNLTHGIIARRGGTTIRLQIGNPVANINELSVTLSQAPILNEGSTLVPLRFVSEALGARVDWDNDRQLVSITQLPQADMPGRHEDDRDRHPDVAAPPPPVAPPHIVVEQPRHEEHAPAPDFQTISIPAGVVVPVQLDTALSSATARDGDVFVATVVSREAGDSEFPAGTKIEGVVTRVSPRHGQDPGVLDIDFRTAILPSGARSAIEGTPIALDNASVLHRRGRIVAKAGKDNTKTDVIVGAGAGFVIGKVLGKSGGGGALLGAVAGLLLGKKQSKGSDVNLPAGTNIGVRLDAPASYNDNTGYSHRRDVYMRS